ncbi:MAG: acyltransferase [Verrucomicrobia bacterium]|nr:acyltransferase [Verrucomicrobiota bacterium]
MSDFSARRVAGLDLVRSAAILSVAAGHYWPLYERFPALAPFKFLGVLGVELFFVLSGFLIGGILIRQAAELEGPEGGFQLRHAPGFWMRRWFRTLPNYVLFFIVFLLFDQPWSKDHWGAWALSTLFLQNLFADWSAGTFGVAWSLCVEEWLYLLLPLLLAWFTSRTKNAGKAALSSALVLIAVPTLLRCTTMGKEWDLGVRHVVVYRLDAIAFGVLLAYVARYRRDLFERIATARWALVGALVVVGAWVFSWRVGSVWIARDEARYGLKWFVMSVLFFPAVNLAIVPIVGWGSRLADVPRGFQTLVYRTSLYSYSMYLAHTLVYYYAGSLIYVAVRSVFGEFRGLTFVMIGLNLIALYGISALVYHVWEAPMTRLRERFAPSRPATASA